MMCRFSQLRRKEVINICDGSRLGCVGDLELCIPEGTVTVVAALGGNVIVKVKEARIAISEEMARKIMI